MSEPIKIGDLVAIVRSCCVGFRDGVSIFRVESMRPTRTSARCSTCGGELPKEPYAADAPQYPGAPVSWLKRIPPLEKLEGLESEEVDKLPTQRMIEAAERYKRLVTSK